MRWKSSRTRTLRSPSLGDRTALCTISRAVSTLMRPWAVDGSMTWRSGWVSASASFTCRSASASSLSCDSRRAAKARAAARLPEPDGPTSRYECTGCSAAAVSWATAFGCPTTSRQTSRSAAAVVTASILSRQVREADLDDRPDLPGDVVLGARGVDDGPAIRVLHRLHEEALVDPVVEGGAGRLHLVPRPVQPGLGRPRLEGQEDDQ